MPFDKKDSLFSKIFRETLAEAAEGKRLGPEAPKELLDNLVKNREEEIKAKNAPEAAAKKEEDKKKVSREVAMSRLASKGFEAKRDPEMLKKKASELESSEKVASIKKSPEDILATDTTAGVLIAHDNTMSAYLQPVMDSFTIDSSDFSPIWPLISNGIKKALASMSASENVQVKDAAGAVLNMPELKALFSMSEEDVFGTPTPELYAALALSLPYLNDIELLYNKDVKKFISSCYTNYESTFGDRKEFEDVTLLSTEKIKEYAHVENPQLREILTKLKASGLANTTIAQLAQEASVVMTSEALNPRVLNKSTASNVTTNIYYGIVSAAFKDNAKFLELNPQISKTVSIAAMLKGNSSLLSDSAKELIFAQKEMIEKSPAMSRGLFGKNARRTLDFLYFKKKQKEGKSFDKNKSESILAIADKYFPGVFKNLEEVITSNTAPNAIEFKKALTTVIELVSQTQSSLTEDILDSLKALRNITDEDYTKLVEAIAEVQLASDAKNSNIPADQKSILIDGAKTQIGIVNSIKAKYATDPAAITSLSWFVDATNFNANARQFQETIPSLDISKLSTDMAKKVFDLSGGKNILLDTFYSLSDEQERHAFFKAFVARKKDAISKYIDTALSTTRNFEGIINASDKTKALQITLAKNKAVKGDSEESIAASIVKKEIHDSMQGTMKSISAIHGIDRSRRDAKQAIEGFNKLEQSLRVVLGNISNMVNTLDTEDKKVLFSEVDTAKASALLTPLVKSAINAMQPLEFLAATDLTKVENQVVDTLSQFASKGYLVSPPLLRVVNTSDAVVKSMTVRDLIDYAAASNFTKKLQEPKIVNGKEVKYEEVVKPITEGSLFDILSGELAIQNARPEILLATQARCYEFIANGLQAALDTPMNVNLPAELRDYSSNSSKIIDNLKKSLSIAAKDLRNQSSVCKTILSSTYGNMRIPLRMGTGEFEPFLREVTIPTSHGKQMDEVIARICIIFAQSLAKKTTTKLSKLYTGFFNLAAENNVEAFAEEVKQVLTTINDVIDFEIVSNLSYVEPKYLEQLQTSPDGKQILSDITSLRTELLEAPFAKNAMDFLASNSSVGLKNVLGLLNVGKHMLSDALIKAAKFGSAAKGAGGAIRSGEERTEALNALGILYGGIFKASSKLEQPETTEQAEVATVTETPVEQEKQTSVAVVDVYKAYEKVKALTDKILGLTKRGKGRDSGERERYAKIKGFDEILKTAITSLDSLLAFQSSILTALKVFVPNPAVAGGGSYSDTGALTIKKNLEIVLNVVKELQNWDTAMPNTEAGHKSILTMLSGLTTPNMEEPSPVIKAIFNVKISEDSKKYQEASALFDTLFNDLLVSGQITIDDMAKAYSEALFSADKSNVNLTIVSEDLLGKLMRAKIGAEQASAGDMVGAMEAVKSALVNEIASALPHLFLGFIRNEKLKPSLIAINKVLTSTEKLQLITPKEALIFNLFRLEDQTPISQAIKSHLRL